MTDRPIPEHHIGLLKTALKLEEEQNLPENIVELYWDTERTARRMGTRLHEFHLVTICLLANRPSLPDPVSLLDENIKAGERVLVKFRNEWRWGEFKGRRGKRLIVQIDDDTAEDRDFGPTYVRRPTKEELSLIGE